MVSVMKPLTKLTIFVGVLMIASLAAFAAGAPTAEIFAGYSYRNFDPAVSGVSRQNGSGWGAELQLNFNRFISGVADFGGHYGTVSDIVPSQRGVSLSTKFRVHEFLFGPRITARVGRGAIFAHALFGTTNLRTNSISVQLGPPFPSGTLTVPALKETDFAMGYGGGTNVNLNRLISLRLIQVDYLPVRNKRNLVDPIRRLFRDTAVWSQNVRIRTGLVLNF